MHRPLRLSLILLSLLPSLLFLSCDGVSDTLRNWGERQRWGRLRELREADLEQWKRDLQISKENARELNRQIQTLVRESSHQGILSWKIARAYMDAGQFDMAGVHYDAALRGELVRPEQLEGGKVTFLDAALPHYEEALLRRKPDPQLLYEAGLCYANSSHELGWEVERWKRAVLLFDRMRHQKPDDTRPLYQMALLYGKTTRPELKNIPFALELLERVIRLEELNLPARFARAHLLVESGDLSDAREEYGNIMEKLEDMHRSGLLSGSVTRDPRYIQAGENAEKLDICIQNLPGCQIRRR